MENTAIETTLTQESTISTPSQRVVEAVAEAKGVDSLDLDPLYEVVDPDALDSIFDPQLKVGEVADASADVRFEYEGYRVRITAAGRVTLDEI